MIKQNRSFFHVVWRTKKFKEVRKRQNKNQPNENNVRYILNIAMKWELYGLAHLFPTKAKPLRLGKATYSAS